MRRASMHNYITPHRGLASLARPSPSRGEGTARFAIAALCLLLSAYCANAGEAAPPDPEIERKSFQVAEGFEVSLFAADPLLAKPIQMNFDAKGRLWVVSSATYPQIKPGDPANDKVLILEDTDNDGKVDKSTVFADGLLIPTGIEPGDGGAYVANSTELVHFKDTNGDGKADERKVVLCGFGTEDTHHVIHTFRWGEDGRLYFNQSIYIDTHVETPWGTKRLGGGGIWGFRPKTMEFDVFVKGMCNPWGHTWDYYGQSFGTDGAGGDGIHYLVTGFTYPHYPGGGKIFPGLNPGSPKYCGAELVNGRHLPDDWQGNIITNDFRAHRVCRFVISEDGSGYASKQMTEVIKSTDQAFRPIDIKMGPDGAIYIADWYNPIINHGEVDFRDARRDKTHGRIWRVTAKGRPLVEKPKLVGAPVEQLLEQLKAPENWTRHFAKRVMAEMDPKTVAPALESWLARLDPKDPQIEHHKLEGLWTYENIGILEPKLLNQLLSSPEPHVRAAATRALSQWRRQIPNAFDLLSTLVTDEFPRVRLEAVRALGNFKTPAAIEAATRVLDKPTDRFMDHALWLTANELKSIWLPEFEAGKLSFDGNLKHLQTALQAVGSNKGIKMIVEQLTQGKLPVENRASALDLLAGAGDAGDAAAVLNFATGKAAPDAQINALSALLKMARARKITPSGDLKALTPLLADQNEQVKAIAIRLAGAWKQEALRAQLQLPAGATESVAITQARTDAIADLGGKPSLDYLQSLCGADKPRNVRAMAVAGISAIDVKAAAAAAVPVLTEDTNGNDALIIFNAFLARQGAGEALAAALKDKKISKDAAKLGLRAIQQAAQNDSLMASALRVAGGLDDEQKEFTKDEMAKIVADAAKLGDPSRGETVFRRNDVGCTRCHSIAGVGGQVGPDLSSIGASAPVDYLVDSLYFPNKAVKEGYHSAVVITKDGRVVTGVKLRQNKEEIALRDANGEDTVIPAANINKVRDAGSLMPSGLPDILTHSELLDLIRFLSEIGRPGPFSVGAAPVARRWMMLAADPKLLKHPADEVFNEIKSNAALPWVPLYSRVNGEIPVSDLGQSVPASVLRCQLDVGTVGKIGVKLNDPATLNVWLDDKPVAIEAGKPAVLNVEKSGIHTLTVRVAHEGRKEPVRCELVEVEGSPAKAQFVGGR